MIDLKILDLKIHIYIYMIDLKICNMFNCANCPEKYIGQTSKKIQTRLTEHQNAINRHDHNSLPAKRADDNGHKFNWSHTKC